MKKPHLKKQLFFLIFYFLLFRITVNLLPVFAQKYTSLKEANKIKQCPDKLETLGNLLVQDIPSYANRVLQKSRKLSREIPSLPVYVIVASKPEFEPIPLSQSQYRNSHDETVKQIFFTTLERQYPQKDRVIETQNYHWLLLTKAAGGWRMVMIFSHFGNPNSNHSSSPFKETTNGVIGQAVKLWLRDCRATLDHY